MRRFALLLLLVATPASAAPGTLASLSWMSGSWAGAGNAGLRIEEYWTNADGTVMAAVHRDLIDKRTMSFEFLRIEQQGDSLVYIALPRGRNETPFPLKSIRGKRVIFENLKHDYPQRIEYWSDAPGTLSARTEGIVNGILSHDQWTWQRVGDKK